MKWKPKVNKPVSLKIVPFKIQIHRECEFCVDLPIVIKGQQKFTASNTAQRMPNIITKGINSDNYNRREFLMGIWKQLII